MLRSRSRSGFARTNVWGSLVVFACVVSMVACESKAASAAEIAQGADLGATIASQSGFEVTLVDPPEKVKVVGGLIKGGQGWQSGQRQWGTQRDAKGIWLIIPVELTNQAQEIQMLRGKAFTVKDGQGREFVVAGRPEHMMKVFSGDRWGSVDNYLVDNPMDSGLTREGPLIFDVAEDATELRLVAEGTGESFSLGF